MEGIGWLAGFQTSGRARCRKKGKETGREKKEKREMRREKEERNQKHRE
jgi:hypothetical protein